MALFLILFKQLITMVLFMAIGFCLFKGKLVTKQTVSALSNLLVYITLPGTIINSFLSERTPEKMKGLGIAIILTVIALLIACLVSFFVFRKKDAERMERFGVSFSNVGFISIPLISATLGQSAVFYAAPFAALLNVTMWSYGIVVLTDKTDAITGKRLIRNQNLIAFVIGIYFAQTDFRKMFTNKFYYKVSLVRLVIIPVITGLVFLLIPAQPIVKLVLLISAIAPIGSNAPIMAQMFGCDYNTATDEVCLTTFLSVFSVSIIAALFSMLYGYSL